ncbi:uncharacterized protein LY89DRAFT_592961 [Mollisia scopiformis]|uniref:Late endosomal/lysosomal adaptor and MAPK and MTOR activator 1 n=1 Tax=Mollisia scopiformis TaxID=149040 RepID=A0A194WXI6_MOLSC|nr:uncharacterized protein LY89DRAFT_592961 [Mollisia scopiformis]KUJ12645.1 hypothetical protein LY89DRAFT_592961 [Mollisia scopiformis]
MGVCFSCIGHDRDRDLSDEDEQSRLLFDDSHTNQYGSFGDHSAGAIQADPQEVQRETEALQKVVMQTSNHLVDIFAMVPQNNVPQSATLAFPVPDARLLRYQDVLAKISSADAISKSNQYLAENTPAPSEGWISDEDDLEEMQSQKPVKSDGVGPLLGGFADAETSME